MVRALPLLAALAAGVTFADVGPEKVLDLLKQANNFPEIRDSFKPGAEGSEWSLPCPKELECEDPEIGISFVSGPNTFSLEYPANAKIKGEVLKYFKMGCVCSGNVGTCSIAATVQVAGELHTIL
ncbi:hypothetical protein GQ602_002916 [Ophiocordyceps camponoti-floridani]|uniref:Uncharacterized protein n=1 Tax=Ophiocordyceps camponoti-floridani TaxID=2030778 RepID=A0A8H4Q731_9HYPO|nr:hypothetical protein GQ602_002916 [Ophiocordyceps camponoti-floridani]